MLFSSICPFPRSISCRHGYHPYQGSSFAGSIGVANNPASITSTPYKWDVTVLALQLKTVSNAYTIYDYSLLSSPLHSKYQDNDGFYQRYADLDFNMNLLNARFAIDRKHTIAFGFNLRGEGRFNTDSYNYNDSIKQTNQFLGINQGNPISGNLVSSVWAKIYASYSQTLWDDDQHRLNGGFTLKSTRGLSGAFAQIDEPLFPFPRQTEGTPLIPSPVQRLTMGIHIIMIPGKPAIALPKT